MVSGNLRVRILMPSPSVTRSDIFKSFFSNMNSAATSVLYVKPGFTVCFPGWISWNRILRQCLWPLWLIVRSGQALLRKFLLCLIPGTERHFLIPSSLTHDFQFDNDNSNNRKIITQTLAYVCSSECWIFHSVFCLFVFASMCFFCNLLVPSMTFFCP